MRLQGRYRVSLNGFRCNNSTWDDALNRDGFGDEVFFQIEYRYLEMDSSGNPVAGSEQAIRRTTKTIGSPGDGRYVFGSARDFWGNLQYGIASGDEFPSSRPWEKRNTYPFPSPDDVPPLLVWEGDLVSDWEGDHTNYWIGRRVTHENIVFVTPSIWERDPGEDALEGWLRWQVDADATFGQKAKEIVSGVWPVAAPVFDAVSLGIKTASTLPSVIGMAGTRPIGTHRDPGTGELFFKPDVLDLTQARAEQLIATNFGYGYGILPYPSSPDDKAFRGDYSFWLQVERIGVLHELKPIVNEGSSTHVEVTRIPLEIRSIPLNKPIPSDLLPKKPKR